MNFLILSIGFLSFDTLFKILCVAWAIGGLVEDAKTKRTIKTLQDELAAIRKKEK